MDLKQIEYIVTIAEDHILLAYRKVLISAVPPKNLSAWPQNSGVILKPAFTLTQKAVYWYSCKFPASSKGTSMKSEHTSILLLSLILPRAASDT